MPEDKSLFICRNENCHDLSNYSGEALTGGMVSEITLPDAGHSFFCKHCKTEHKLVDGEVYLVHTGGELVIENSSDYNDFNSQYETNRVFFEKLIIRNFDTTNFRANEISFNACMIGELIIENINIDSAYSPLTFSNCTIESVKVSKTIIREIKSNNYKSLWSFFGINFFNSGISGEMVMDKTDTSISISRCEIKKPIKLSGKSNVHIALVHCQKIPAIKADKTSSATQILEAPGRDPSNKKKKISTVEKSIRNFSIEELIVEAETAEPALIENCHITLLRIPEGKNIKGKLIFRNCIVDKVDNKANSFDQDLVFFGCKFQHQIMLTGSHFKRSLVFEFCTFQSGVVLNNIDIDRDLQMNHATVTGDILLEGNRCQGYFKSRFNAISGLMSLEDNSIARDLNIIHIIIDKSLACKYNEIGGYVFLKQLKAKGGINLNMLNADSLNIIDVSTDKDLDLETINLKNDLKINRIMLGGNLAITFSSVEGMINMSRSRILENFTAYFLDSKLNMFIGIEVHGGLNFNSCKFLLHTWANRNIFKGNMFWNTMQTHNVSFNSNRVLNEFSLDTLDAKAITIDKNIVDQSIEINNSHSEDMEINENICGGSIQIKSSGASDIRMNVNYVQEDMEFTKVEVANAIVSDNKLNNSFKIDGSGMKDLKFWDNNIFEKVEISNSSIRDLLSEGNMIRDELMLNFLEANDFRFINNLVEKLNIFNSSLTEVVIKECPYIGDTNLNGIKVGNGFKIFDNNIAKEIYLHQCFIGQKTEIEYNFADAISISNSEIHDIRLIGNNLLEKISLTNSKTNDVTAVNNQSHQTLFLQHLQAGVVRLEGNIALKEVSLFNLNSEDVNLLTNDFRDEVKIEYPQFEDMLIKGNRLGNISIANGSIMELKLGNSSGIGNCILYGLAIKKDIYFFNVVGTEFLIRSCQVGNNILLEDNFFSHVDFKDNRANDIILNKNVIDKFLEFSDIQSNDIIISSNKISFAFSEERTTEEENKDPMSIVMRNCVIENNLDLNDNTLPETILIKQNLSDKLSFTKNRTKSLKLSMGRYRQLGIGNCEEIWDFSCNNVTVDRDISIYNNVFHEDFAMLYCKVENDLDFDNNVFKDVHRLFNNTIQGTTNYKNEKLALTMNIQQNRFNFFNVGMLTLEGTFYLINNTIDGGMILGKANDDQNSDPFRFLQAVSISENKIKTATFQYLDFQSSLCIRHNNFEGDLTFRDSTHLQTLDFTSCFIGGSFVFYNSTKQNNDGHLVLDNAFIDKRITFTNYYPASFSYIRATFNGFEVPDDWCMRKKQLHTTRKDFDKDASVWERMYKKIIRFFTRKTDTAILIENQLRSQSYKKANLPYSMMKDHYLEDKELNKIPAAWKKIKSDLFLNEELLKKLDQTHRREDKQTDGALLRKYFGLYDQCVTEDFIPIYYSQFSDYALNAIIEGASEFSTLENNYKDDDTIEVVERLKAYFGVFHKALLYFKGHSFHVADAPACQSRFRYKNLLFKNLEEQYKVLRHIWRDNGELKEEDAAYYKWMHFKNISSMRVAALNRKPKFWMRYLLYEKVFGWGVDLFRIVISTLGIVGIFTLIYFFIFRTNPELYVYWDNVKVYGSEITGWKPFVFAIQTTFSAGLGDWAPIGSGIIKIPMTINAILGVLFVTFLIGAYGRKMLR